jgi:CheY-like chemotaxis protein
MSDRLLEGKTILIVEDNTFLSNVISQKLSLRGARALTYTNGLEGLAAIRAEKPDLVLLDILMPIMNGYEVLQVLNSEGLTQDIPIIVISNSGQPVEIERIKALGVREYLIKADFEPDDVLQKVYETLHLAPQSNDYQMSSPSVATPAPTATTEPTLPRVLVVEDDPLLRNLLAMKLSNSNCPAMFSNDGLHVMDLVSTFSPEVIVLDLRLPGKDGFEILKDLKANPATKQIPVVIFSNNSSEEDQKRTSDLGAAAFYVKAMTDLNEFIQELVKIARKTA